MLWLLLFSVFSLLLLISVFRVFFFNNLDHTSTIIESRNRKLIEWGKSFGGLQSQTVRIEECSFGAGVGHGSTKNEGSKNESDV